MVRSLLLPLILVLFSHAAKAAFSLDDPSRRWPAGRIPYLIHANVPPSRAKLFEDCLREWELFADVKFIPRTTQANHVMLADAGTLEIESAGEIGMAGGQQMMWIATDSWSRRVLLREIGRLLGLYYEHQRPNRAEFLTVNLVPVPVSQQVYFSMISSGSTMHGTYDFHSIMHFGPKTKTDGSAPALSPTQAHLGEEKTMGRRDVAYLTLTDRAAIAALYGPGPALSSVVANTQDSGPGSLRQAIYHAAAVANTTITFNIPTTDPNFLTGAYWIRPSDGLPPLGPGTVVDGASQPGNTNSAGPEIVLSGSVTITAAYASHGLVITSAGCSVRGLNIQQFRGSGILLDGVTANGNSIRGCHIGNGSANNEDGITSVNGAHTNSIGGTTNADQNVISGNLGHGIHFKDTTHHNVVEGNTIGGNQRGIQMGDENAAPSHHNTIGGTAEGARNIIIVNRAHGIRIVNGHDNLIQGNVLGDSVGSAPIPQGNGFAVDSNQVSAIELFMNCHHNLIGGTTAAARNVIAGNNGNGILLYRSPDNVIQGNYIGVDIAGTRKASNTWHGVALLSAARTRVVGNVISASGESGVFIHPIPVETDPGPVFEERIHIAGNLIGLNAEGTEPFGNSGDGIVIRGGSSFNLIGGYTAEKRNLIAGNKGYGVLFSWISNFSPGSPNLTTRSNTVAGNWFGLSKDGVVVTSGILGNSTGGVGIQGCFETMIGGSRPGAGNVIRGFGISGVALLDQSSQNSVQGNSMIFLRDGPGEGTAHWSGAGVNIWNGAKDNLIGGTTPGAGNFIAGNAGAGIWLNGSTTANNRILGNMIGQTAEGTFAANRVGIAAEASGLNYIGDIATGSGNIIQGASRGIILDNASSLIVLGNSIFGLSSATIESAIELVSGRLPGGRNPIDAFDTDTGPNGLQNYPVLTSAVMTSAGITITGRLTSLPSTNFRIEFFASPNNAAQPNLGDGQYFLGAMPNLTTLSDGQGTFNQVLPPLVRPGWRICATATLLGVGTSEFSLPVTITATDPDNDAMPSDYEIANGLNPNAADAEGDLDGDGVKNRMEMLLGTDPRRFSEIPMPDLTPSGTDMRLTFPSTQNRVFRLEAKESLDPSTPWRRILGQITSSASVLDPEAASRVRRFYRFVPEAVLE